MFRNFLAILVSSYLQIFDSTLYFNAFVSDRPDKPKNVKPDRASEDTITLSWTAPTWDGGSPIHNYTIEKQETPMTSWIRCGHTRLEIFLIIKFNRKYISYFLHVGKFANY